MSWLIPLVLIYFIYHSLYLFHLISFCICFNQFLFVFFISSFYSPKNIPFAWTVGVWRGSDVTIIQKMAGEIKTVTIKNRRQRKKEKRYYDYYYHIWILYVLMYKLLVKTYVTWCNYISDARVIKRFRNSYESDSRAMTSTLIGVNNQLPV